MVSRRTESTALGGEPAQGRELRARGRRTLRRLLDAGAQVFAERGYHAARVDDIVKLAKTSHGTFYLYFRNKEDLFRALVGEVADEMQQLAETLGTDPSSRDALRDWIEQFCDLYARHGAVIRAWTEAEISNTDFGRMGEGVLVGFSTAVAKHVRNGTPRRQDGQIASLAVVAMLERLNYYVLTSQVELDRDAMVDVLTDVTYTALFE
jgi:AcrR family transcriptional regulator